MLCIYAVFTVMAVVKFDVFYFSPLMRFVLSDETSYYLLRYDKYYQTPRIWLTGYDEVSESLYNAFILLGESKFVMALFLKLLGRAIHFP